MMNLMHWRLLVAVADTGSVSRAAERCAITQSGASQAISQIEATLGVNLFLRDRRKTSVTAIGEPVLEHARRMLAELDSIRTLVDESRGLHAGVIKLATFASVFTSFLPNFLRSFCERHPGIEIVLLEGTDEEIEAWLAAGTVDVGVVLNPRAERNASLIGRDAWIVVVPTHHPLARRSSSGCVSLAEIVDQPFVLATGGCHLNSQRLVESLGLALSNIRITVRDWPTAFTLIRGDVGLSVVPESTLPENRQGMRVLNLDAPIYREFGLVCSESGYRMPAVSALLSDLRRNKTNDISVPLREDVSPGNIRSDFIESDPACGTVN